MNGTIGGSRDQADVLFRKPVSFLPEDVAASFLEALTELKHSVRLLKRSVKCWCHIQVFVLFYRVRRIA